MGPCCKSPLSISRLDGSREPHPGKGRRLEQLPPDNAHAGLNCSGSEVAREAKCGSDCVLAPEKMASLAATALVRDLCAETRGLGGALTTGEKPGPPSA